MAQRKKNGFGYLLVTSHNAGASLFLNWSLKDAEQCGAEEKWNHKRHNDAEAALN